MMKFNLKHLAEPSDVILIYEGKFDMQATKSVLHLAERNIDSISEDPSIKRKVFNILVECLQNVIKHGEHLENPDPDHGTVPRLVIGREPKYYTIASGNAMLTEHVAALKSRIDHINSLDKEGLKSMYKQIMRNNNVSEKGGAGLGLVDMARKSGDQLSYQFDTIDKKFSFFSFKTVIAR